MSRELKFRAWDTSFNKMITRYITPDFRLAINSDGKVIGYEEETDENECLEYHDRFKVMQFTGLHDKNGKEIYEADIVIMKLFDPDMNYEDIPSLITGGVFEVFYDESECLYSLRNKSDNWTPNQIGCFRELEIIGNMYENGNLL